MTLTEARPKETTLRTLAKSPTGVVGLDEITGGGIPRGRPTLVCGSAGCGKTLLSMEFLVRGILEFGEPGVFMSFEETPGELTENVRSLGFDLDRLIEDGKLVLEHVRVERSEIAETGEYDLEALFIRLAYAIDTVGAKRVVLDTIETLFGGLSNEGILRAEIRRLFGWLKEKGVTAVITGERGEGTLTRQGLEEYVSDCVILLDHRVIDQVATRRLRIVKYRGTVHGTNEYPFLIDERGIDVLPVTSVGLDHEVSAERVSSGIAGLDAMLTGGFYRGSSVLVSGTAGTGKSSLAAHFAAAACRRGERCLHFAFEESPRQIVRNMRSIGLDLDPFVTQGRLLIHASRPTVHGLEAHLAVMYKMVRDFRPQAVVVDPITNFMPVGSTGEIKSMLMRLVDMLKSAQVTAFFTSLSRGGLIEETDIGLSSLIDTWLLVRDIETNGERNRGIYVLKSRGMPHSNQIREFRITERGIELTPAYLGPSGVLTGSARVAQEARDRTLEERRQHESARAHRRREQRRRAIEARIMALQAMLEEDTDDMRRQTLEDRDMEARLTDARERLARSRHADRADSGKPGKERSE